MIVWQTMLAKGVLVKYFQESIPCYIKIVPQTMLATGSLFK